MGTQPLPGYQVCHQMFVPGCSAPKVRWPIWVTSSINVVGNTFFGHVLNQAANGDSGPPRDATNDAPDDEGSGISLVLIETREEGDQGERLR